MSEKTNNKPHTDLSRVSWGMAVYVLFVSLTFLSILLVIPHLLFSTLMVVGVAGQYLVAGLRHFNLLPGRAVGWFYGLLAAATTVVAVHLMISQPEAVTFFGVGLSLMLLFTTGISAEFLFAQSGLASIWHERTVESTFGAVKAVRSDMVQSPYAEKDAAQPSITKVGEVTRFCLTNTGTDEVVVRCIIFTKMFRPAGKYQEYMGTAENTCWVKNLAPGKSINLTYDTREAGEQAWKCAFYITDKQGALLAFIPVTLKHGPEPA
ncbi:MAG: hypothetical protein GC134_03160 [Proteobacteria bacterium]|nr:hypothetical protein [Pseudomonadota bacterium]